MNTPKITDNYYKERDGVLKVAMSLNQFGYIFRETPNGDIGIDGQIEQVNEKGEAVGKLVAAQIKSGNSYLIDKGNHFIFYPQEKHKNYWAIFPIPVILFVYYPMDGNIYFTDVRYQLNIPSTEHECIILSKNRCLNKDTAPLIFETTGNFDIPYHPIDKAFDIMLRTICPNPTFNISYLDLFTQGLTNICRHLYFSMDLAIVIAEYNNKTEFGAGIGYHEHEFLHSYTKFLMSQNFATIDYSNYLIDWRERELLPTFIAPLNPRGYQLLDYIKKIQATYQAKLPPTTLIRERQIQMMFYSQDDFWRLELGQKLREVVPETNRD